jgi:hypothetical protein
VYRCKKGNRILDDPFFLNIPSEDPFPGRIWQNSGIHTIRKIIARIRKMMISHFPIAQAILPINPRIINITAIMMNSIPSVRSQLKIVYHL